MDKCDVMNHMEVIEIAETCSRAYICVFSRTVAQTKHEFLRYAMLGYCIPIRSQNILRFENGSLIKFITGDDIEDIAGSEIILAVMNDVVPTINIRSRVRVGMCKDYEQFGLPKIVQYD